MEIWSLMSSPLSQLADSKSKPFVEKITIELICLIQKHLNDTFNIISRFLCRLEYLMP